MILIRCCDVCKDRLRIKRLAYLSQIYQLIFLQDVMIHMLCFFFSGAMNTNNNFFVKNTF